MPEYLIPVIERQVSRRAGWRRVTADTQEAAISEAFDRPDDNATDWGPWDGPESTLRADEDRAAYEAPPLIHGVLSTLVDGDQLIEPWVEQLRISERLSIGLDSRSVQRLYYTAEGADGTPVPLDDDALSDRPESLRDLAYHLTAARQSECVTLDDALAIKAVFTSDAERALHDFLTGRPCG